VAGDHTTHFGFRTVQENEKEGLVKEVFSNVASKYDIMNDAMSLGVHRLWKDTLVSTLQPGKRGPMKCLDVAGGTGDIALRILDHARENYADRETTVEILDINPEMLKEGMTRFKKSMYHNSELCSRTRPSPVSDKFLSLAPQISFTEGNAQELNLPSNHYDLYTIVFGIRNVTSIPDVLKEAYRVLKPGGTFACMEFSRVNNPLLSTCVYLLL
jgi:2-methoxy-6-polyprenyl-1,4-benzoquinol methylase